MPIDFDLEIDSVEPLLDEHTDAPETELIPYIRPTPIQPQGLGLIHLYISLLIYYFRWIIYPIAAGTQRLHHCC